MVLRATLNVHVPWSALAPVLGLPCPSQALPLDTDCPFCRGPRLRIYDDSTTAGQWHYCLDCHASGDMVELAAGVWGVTAQYALTKLAAAGFAFPADRSSPADFDRYVRDHPARRGRAKEFWGHATAYLARGGSNSLASLRAAFRCKGQMSPGRWAEGPGRLVGGYPARDVERVFGYVAPNGFADGDCRMFVGRDWRDVLVFPHHCVPDRFSGFLFVGRSGRPEDRVFRGTPMQSALREGGLWGLSTLESAGGPLAGYAVAVADPLLGLRLQVRHFATAGLPLPVVAWADNRTHRTKSWTAVGRRRVVFWGFELTAPMLYQAALCDGLISVVPLVDVTPRRVDHYLRLEPAADTLKKAVRHAVPWREALRSLADAGGLGRVEELLSALAAYRVDVRTLSRDLGPDVEELMSVEPVRTARVGGITVTERNDAWWYTTKTAKTPALFSDVVLRVDRIVSGTPATYECSVRYKGESVKFSTTQRELETDAARLIREKVNHLGRPNFRRCGKTSMVDVAVAFHPPLTVVPCPHLAYVDGI